MVEIQPPTTPPKGPSQKGKGEGKRAKALLAIISIVLLAAAALAVIFWLPEMAKRDHQGGSRPHPPEISATSATSATRAEPGQGSTVIDTDAGEAEEAALKEKAQEAERRWLEKRAWARLNDIPTWAGKRYEEALEISRKAKDLLEKGSFQEASRLFERAAQMVTEIEASKGQILEESIREGSMALDRADGDAATAAFRRALAIDPRNQQALLGIERAKTIEQTSKMVQQARKLMDKGDLQGALGLLEETLGMDPYHEEAKGLLSEARAALARKEFQKAVGRAISALAAGRYQEASKALSEAKKIDPSDPALQKLALKLEQERRAARLSHLIAKAHAAMERESWKEAEGLYRLALETAPDSVDAQDGLRLAKERAAIEDALGQIVSSPWSLNQPGPYSDAKKVVDRALSIQAPGPRLGRLIKQAQRTLMLARKPVQVTFLSDGLTDIVIYRVGRLGMVKSRALKLLPGIYTVKGSRPGYRDVMKRLEIAPGSRPLTVEIVCREKI